MSDSKKMIPLIILMVVAGGIVTWGFLTDWTFSGLLPREGAKCTPDEKDENAKQYVYDENNECTVIESCKTGWKPDTPNTACTYSSDGTECTPTGTPVTNGKYTFDDEGECNLTSCKNNFKLNSESSACDDCIDGYTLDGTTCRACAASDVIGFTGRFNGIPGQTYVSPTGNCVPKRMLFPGNNGTVSCDAYCAGADGEPWQGNAAAPADWKGAKCIGTGYFNGTTFEDTTSEVGCSDTRHIMDKVTEDDNAKYVCNCEMMDDGWRGSSTFTIPTTVTNTDGDASQSKGFWGGPLVELRATTLASCETEAIAGGFNAYVVRDSTHSTEWKNTCAGVGLDWANPALDQNHVNNMYTVCTNNTKNVINACK